MSARTRAVAAPTMPTTRRWNKCRAWASWAVVAVFIALWSVHLRPVAFGGTTTLVGVGGVSMEPMIHSGDLAIVRRETDYEVGDVIAFRPDAGNAPPIVLHRIVGIDGAEGFRMQGDNNDGADPWTPEHKDVIGRLRWRLPLVGWLVRALHELL